jgi:hypothetical protein
MLEEESIKETRHCSPTIAKDAKKNKTCYSYEYLVLLVKLYNSSHSDKIDISKIKNKKGIWNALQKKLDNECGSNEACWLEQPFVKNSVLKEKMEERFRPKKPLSWYKNPEEWLNTYDILDVMKQYEESDKSYYFVGVFPVDFASTNTHTGVCVVQEMCKLHLATEWKRGIKRVGVVFNTDDSKSSGEHWISAFIGLDPKRRNFGVYFYDSVAMSPPKEVMKFLKQMQKELSDLHPKQSDKVALKVNRVRRQYKNSNCGIFSVLFHILMMKYNYDVVCEKMGYDDDVQKFRDLLYRSSKK